MFTVPDYLGVMPSSVNAMSRAQHETRRELGKWLTSSFPQSCSVKWVNKVTKMKRSIPLRYGYLSPTDKTPRNEHDNSRGAGGKVR